MTDRKFTSGDLITNGSSAGRVIEYVEHDTRWKTGGYRIQNIGLETFGGDAGYTSFVPGYLANGWKAMPEGWAPVVGGGLEERYVWVDGYRRMRRELRQAEDHSTGKYSS